MGKEVELFGFLKQLCLTEEDFQFDGQEWVIEDFIPCGSVNLLEGWYGGYASFLALLLTKKAIDNSTRVIYLDGETPKPYVYQNLKKLGLEEHLNKKLFYFLGYKTTGASLYIEKGNVGWEELKFFADTLATKGKVLIVIDRLHNFVSENELFREEPEVFNLVGVFRELSRLCRKGKGKTVLAIHYKGIPYSTELVDGTFSFRKEEDKFLLSGYSRYLGEKKLELELELESD